MFNSTTSYCIRKAKLDGREQGVLRTLFRPGLASKPRLWPGLRRHWDVRSLTVHSSSNILEHKPNPSTRSAISMFPTYKPTVSNHGPDELTSRSRAPSSATYPPTLAALLTTHSGSGSAPRVRSTPCSRPSS